MSNLTDFTKISFESKKRYCRRHFHFVQRKKLSVFIRWTKLVVSLTNARWEGRAGKIQKPFYSFNYLNSQRMIAFDWNSIFHIFLRRCWHRQCGWKNSIVHFTLSITESRFSPLLSLARIKWATVDFQPSSRYWTRSNFDLIKIQANTNRPSFPMRNFLNNFLFNANDEASFLRQISMEIQENHANYLFRTNVLLSFFSALLCFDEHWFHRETIREKITMEWQTVESLF